MDGKDEPLGIDILLRHARHTSDLKYGRQFEDNIVSLST
jgi:hypothetical protein